MYTVVMYQVISNENWMLREQSLGCLQYSLPVHLVHTADVSFDRLLHTPAMVLKHRNVFRYFIIDKPATLNYMKL